MASYVVMEPPRTAAGDAVLVRDGFAFPAFLIPVLWFLFHRMWIEALAAFAAALLLAALGTVPGWSAAATLMSLCVSLFAGLEARNLRLAMLRRRGWSEWGVIEAAGRDDAEIRYLAERGRAAEPPSATVEVAAPGSRREGGPALGLLSYPGAR